MSMSKATRRYVSDSHQPTSNKYTTLVGLNVDTVNTNQNKLIACWVIFHLLLSSADFLKINFFKKSFRNTIRVTNRLDPGQVRHYVGLDLGANCLQRLLADNKSH